MIDQDIQTKIDASTELLNQARTFVETSDFDEAERCANEVIGLLEPHESRTDLGEERDTTSQKNALINHLAHAYNRLMVVAAEHADYSQALLLADKGIDLAKNINHQTRINRIENNIGNIYLALADYPVALEYYRRALAFSEQQNDQHGVALSLNNIGNAYSRQSEYTNSLEYTTKALAIFTELNDIHGQALSIGNIGVVYSFIPDKLHLAFEYYQQSLALYEQIGNMDGIARNLGNLGELYSMKHFSEYDAGKAEEFLLKAISLLEKMVRKDDLNGKIIYLVSLYEQEERWKDAYTYLSKANAVKDEIRNDQAIKQVHQLEQRKLIAERDKQQAVEHAKHEATEQLLHKVLPSSIATRMIAGEEKIADYYHSVSILFADIVGFTSLASEIPPDVVVDLLNHVFDVFDEIIKHYGCEKVKTIGDGYMAVSGAPEKCEDHAERLARAALDMQKDIHLPEEIREHLPSGTKFNIRIGIHTGSAVCGVMGRERFVWDVYSDAVNTAARMESNGEPGKINVSKDFVWLLRSRQRLTKGIEEFTFIEREEIGIKGKGMMRTYFLEKTL